MSESIQIPTGHGWGEVSSVVIFSAAPQPGEKVTYIDLQTGEAITWELTQEMIDWEPGDD